ncbi:MAG: hypothetical protein IE890_12575 [Arcobacter sp.]|nr:hypothetical protein [Arcobacter sp.]
MLEAKNNPFENGHIKNYILLYISVLVIMVLFFIAGELFIEDKEIEKKVFKTDTNHTENSSSLKPLKETKEEFKPKFQLLDKAY